MRGTHFVSTDDIEATHKSAPLESDTLCVLHCAGRGFTGRASYCSGSSCGISSSKPGAIVSSQQNSASPIPITCLVFDPLNIQRQGLWKPGIPDTTPFQGLGEILPTTQRSLFFDHYFFSGRENPSNIIVYSNFNKEGTL